MLSRSRRFPHRFKGRTFASLPVASLPVAFLLVAGCDDGAGVEPIATPPEITGVTVTDDGGPIFRAIAVDLDRAGGIVVDYAADGAPSLRVEDDAPGDRHELFLPRLRAGHTYRYEARSAAEDGTLGEPRSGTFTTAPLPDGLREIQLSTVGVPTFPLTMVEALAGGVPYFPFVVDEAGYIVWYHESERGSVGFTVLADGAFVFNVDGGLRVVNLRNEVVARLDPAVAAARTGIDPFTIHHDVIRTPRNTLLMLVQDTALVGDTVWTGEAIWEWDAASDALEKRWASKDFLDPAVDRGARSVPEDWLHANSLSIGPRGNVVVSLFWLHEVLSIAPDFASIEWRLGGPASSFQVEDDAMEAGQHTAAEVEPNRVLMFDNGRDRSVGFYSRALEMEIQPGAGLARVAWQFRPVPDIYAPILSSARRLDNGNTVIAFGTADGAYQGSRGPISVFEVTPGNRVLWKLEVVSGFDFAYRATPLHTLGGEVEVR